MSQLFIILVQVTEDIYWTNILHKIQLPQLETELLREILAVYRPAQDDEIWLVGGSIRDLVCGKDKIPDLDLAVSFDPVPLAREYSRRKRAGFVVLDDERQVVRVVKSYDSLHYNVDIARFRAENIEADLRARDFTINAMAARINPPLADSCLEIFDPLNGFQDLANKQIRQCSAQLFSDDPLRLMRAFRFAAILDAEFSPELMPLVKEQAQLLQGVSGERIRDELFKVLACDKSHYWIEQMHKTGLMGTFLPELSDCEGIAQNEWHHLDVFHHSILTLKNLEEIRPHPEKFSWWPQLKSYLAEPISAGRDFWQTLKLGCLLHDLGKPACKKTDSENGRVIFHGHEMEGVHLCKAIAERLRLSCNELHFLQKIVKNHMRPGVILQQGISDKRLFRYYSETGRDGVAIALLSLADRMSAQGDLSEKDLEEFSAGIYSIIDEFYQQQRKPKRAPLLTGADLIKELQLKPGPRFKELLEALAEAQYTGEITNREQALAMVKKLL